MNKYADALANAMFVSASEEINRTHNPKLTKGRIVGISGDNYIVELLGNQYTISSISGAKHKVNETVWVCKPYGENTEQFILGGEITSKTTVGSVLSVNNKEGNVVLDKADIGLNNVDNTSDLKKPISTETQTALDNKVDKVSGKQLSDENYTLAEKTKLESIENNANDYTHPTTHPSTMITGLTKVANTGDYNDLINKPLILNGKDGVDGYTPIKGIDYFDGKDGTNLNLKVSRQYDTCEDLPTNPDIGYMCLVGSDLYIFADNGWVNAGKLTDIDLDIYTNIDGGLFTDGYGVIIGESALEALQDHTTDDDTHANLIIDGTEV